MCFQLCEDLFNRIRDKETNADVTFSVEVSSRNKAVTSHHASDRGCGSRSNNTTSGVSTAADDVIISNYQAGSVMNI